MGNAIRDFRLALAVDAAKRWLERDTTRAQQDRRLRDGGPAMADTPLRVEAFRRRQMLRGAEATDGIAFAERVVGPTLDLEDQAPSPSAAAAGAPVARITNSPRRGLEPVGFGTGFLVAPDVLLTNHHVLPDRQAAEDARAQFGYERTTAGVSLGTYVSIDPARGFLSDRTLDCTFVRLSVAPGIGPIPLIGSQGKILLGHPISIIQHPNGQPRKYGVRDNRLLDILEDHLHYSTDTLPGSSGAPAFNRQWEVVALHHSGVPMIQDGKIRTRRGEVWDPQTMSDDDIFWVANEGVRVSRIVAFLQRHASDPSHAPLVRAVLGLGAALPIHGLEYNPNQLPTETPMSTVINIHAPTTIHIGGSGPVTTSLHRPVSVADPVIRDHPSDAFEGVSIDQDYPHRKGYDANFLGAGTLKLKLPAISDPSVVAPLLDGDLSGVLHYHHFTLVMHAERRLAIYTAVNIDGKTSKRLERSNDKWFFDPRLARQHQIGEQLYANNPLDRGHLVRRLDPAWGPYEIAKVANDDTFHFTNCSPQHANFNQKIWNELEDYLLDHASEDLVRLTVFTGPIFESDDPHYRDVQLPRRFWKVAAMKSSQGSLLAAGFIQSQSKMIRGLEEQDFLRQETRTDQVPIAEIESLAGLRFGIAPKADPLSGSTTLQFVESARTKVRPLASLKDIQL